MPVILVLLFVIVPLIELAIILQVGQVVGPWWTIALLVAFSVAGAALLRHQGRLAWRAFRRALEEGRWPGDEVTQGALVIVGGTLLLTPGFMTDGLGMLMLVPVTRSVLSRVIRKRVTPAGIGLFGAKRARDARARPDTARQGGETARGEVLDVEVVDIQRDARARGSAAGDERAGDESADASDEDPPEVR